MPRPLRLHVPGGFYHVTLRGNHRLPIFHTEQDRSLLDEIVAEATERLAARIHAYCWMTNHLHLLLQVSDAPVGQVVLRIASRHARIVQARLATTGHLFERRYHAVLVDVDAYLLTVIRYIHLNPVKAGIVADPSDYRWCSHQDYLGKAIRPWVTTGFVMKILGSSEAVASAAYRTLMQRLELSTEEMEPFEPTPSRSRILGDDDFVARVTAPRESRPAACKGLEQLVSECCERFECSPELLTSPSKVRSLSIARAWLCQRAITGGVATHSGIARRLNRDESAIRRLMARRRCREPSS